MAMAMAVAMVDSDSDIVSIATAERGGGRNGTNARRQQATAGSKGGDVRFIKSMTPLQSIVRAVKTLVLYKYVYVFINRIPCPRISNSSIS